MSGILRGLSLLGSGAKGSNIVGQIDWHALPRDSGRLIDAASVEYALELGWARLEQQDEAERAARAARLV